LEKDRKIQIIKAAEKRFAKHGIGKTTLDEIARDLRIGKATIYHYFDSKEDLYNAALEWESAQILEEIKIIFENDKIGMKEKLGEYFTYKEYIQLKYKLVFETVLHLMGDSHFEKETEIIASMIKQEEKMMETIFNSIYDKKKDGMNPYLPGFFVIQSWGMLFGTKLDRISNPGEPVNAREVIYKAVENLLSP